MVSGMNDITLHDLVFVPFISAKEIELTVESLAKKVDQDYAGKNPTLLVVLNGAFVFAADLVRKISIPINISEIPVHLNSFHQNIFSQKFEYPHI